MKEHKQKRTPTEKDRESARIRYHSWKKNGYAKVNVWCPLEIKKEIKEYVAQRIMEAVHIRKTKLNKRELL